MSVPETEMRRCSHRAPGSSPFETLEAYGDLGCICIGRNSAVRVRWNVILRETAEVLAIVFAELRVALVSDSDACFANVDALQKQAFSRLLKADTPLILNRRHAGNGFEVLVE